ncbi:hypothetical protein [Chroococcidiopsis sp.]|uniref:hypothetical protein n=1 Tax=Chroococcidiopsis sp. TaxID=3088168 RepID=UPI003F3D3EB4
MLFSLELAQNLQDFLAQMCQIHRAALSQKTLNPMQRSPTQNSLNFATYIYLDSAQRQLRVSVKIRWNF